MGNAGFGNRLFRQLAFVVGIVLLVPLLLAGCGFLPRDNCTQGDNMTDPRVSGSFDASLPAPDLRIVWDQGTLRGADLPSDYFDEVLLSVRTDPDVAALVGGVERSAERAFTVMFTDLSSYLESSESIDLILEFPDRLGFVSCSHSGMRDRYFLEISLVFDAENNLVDATFVQTIFFGAI